MNPFLYSQDRLYAARYAWLLYHGDWMANKIITIPVFDMLRKGWNWKYRGEDTEVDDALQKECDRLDLHKMMTNAKTIERLMGGSVAIRVTREMNAGNVDASTPITPEEIGEGDIVCYNVVSPINITRVEWQMDAGKAGYMRPLHYYVSTGGGQTVYHRSRLVVFDGNPLSPYPQLDFASMTQSWNGFGTSVLAPIWDVLMRANAYQQGAAHLANMCSVWFLMYKGLKDLKGTRQGNKAIAELKHIVESMSNYKGVVLDGDDSGGADVKNISASFGSMPELVMSGIQIVAAAADIHLTRFSSSQAAGLSNNDRSGLENYYDMISAKQKLELTPILEQEKRFLLRSAGLNVDPEDISHEWENLWNLSDTEEAQVRTLHINNAVNMANSLGVPVEWAMKQLKQIGAIDDLPDLDAMERQRVLDEITAFQGMDKTIDDEHDVSGENGVEKPSANVQYNTPKAGVGKPRMPSISQSSGAARLSAMNAAEWDESKHPRADDGKFGRGSGSSSVEKSKKKSVREARDFSKEDYASRWDSQTKQIANGLSRTTPKLDGEILSSVKDYANEGYERINGVLRGGSGVPTENEKKLIKNIDSAIESSDPIPVGIMAYRGVSGDFKEFLLEHDEFIDRGYGSTSISGLVADSFANGSVFNRMEIMIPEGSKGLFMPAATTPPDLSTSEEAEFLLPRNAKYKVHKLLHGRVMLEYKGVDNG